MSRTSRVIVLLLALLAPLLPLGLPAANAADCAGTLTAEDFAADAPPLVGRLDSSTASACFDVDLPAGAVVGFGYASWRADITLSDGTTDEPCGFDGDLLPCTIEPDRTYRLQISARGRPVDYSVRLLRIDGPTTCADLPAGSTSDPVGVLSESSNEGTLVCRTVDLHARQVVINADRPGNWRLYDAAGRFVCDDLTPHGCPSTPGRHTLVVSQYSGGTSDLRGRVSTLDLDASCGTTTTNWHAPEIPIDADVAGTFRCYQMTEVAPGDPVLGGNQFSNDAWAVLDDQGAPACITWTPCRLTGRAPYTLVAWSPPGVSHTYPVAVRRIGATSDCPEVSPLAFGEAPADEGTPTRCRRFRAEAGHRYVVRVRIPDGPAFEDLSTGVYAQDGESSMGKACAWPSCDLGSGWATVTTGVYDKTDATGYAIYDLSSSRGCTTPRIGAGGHRVGYRPAVVACEAVPASDGSRVLRASYLDENTMVRYQWLRSDGSAVTCADNYSGWFADATTPCTLTGPGPFRLIAHSYNPYYGKGHHEGWATTVVDTQLRSCPTLGPGPSHARAASFGPNQVARCYRMPVEPSARRAAWAWSADSTRVRVLDGGAACDDVMHAGCAYDPDKTTRRLVVVGRPGATTRTATVDVTKGPYNWVAPRVRGTCRSGGYANSMPGEWAGLDGPVEYSWFIDGRRMAGATGPRVDLPAHTTGHQLTVRITGHGSGRSRVVTSAPVTIRPPS